MTLKFELSGLLVAFAVMHFGAGPLQAASPVPDAPKLSASELEKLAAPIALHPDPLVSIILPASAYPLEIVQAARFVQNTNNIAKLDDQAWDENVKAVARFPQLIEMMDKDIGWTISLGNAFISQPKELMDMIQSLRTKAMKAGTLQSSQQQVVNVTNVVVVETNLTKVVTVTNQVIQVAPSNPQVIYVPSYPSTVYYPPPTYVYDPWAPLVSFGVGITVGAIIANNCDWHHGGVYVGHHGFVAWGGSYHGDVDIDIDNVNIDRDNVNVDRDNVNIDRDARQTGQGQRQGQGQAQQKWQPDQNRLKTSGSPATVQSREARGWGTSGSPATRPTSTGTPRPTQSAGQNRAGSQGQTYNWSQNPSPQRQQSASQTAARNTGVPNRTQTPQAGARPSTTSAGNRGGTLGGGTLGGAAPSQTYGGTRQSAPRQSYSAPSPSPSTAFGGVNSGGGARAAGARGAASRGGGRR